MAIVYHEKDKTITLQTAHSTYQMKIAPYGVLQHTYYGGKVSQGDMSGLWQAYDRGFSGNPNDADNHRAFSLDTLPQEYPSAGVGDFRIPGASLVNGDGSRAGDWRYKSHEIRSGKYSLPGLPALYAGEEEADTLEIVLEDKAGKSRLTLTYGVFPEIDVITRTAALTNLADAPMEIGKLASLCLDMPFGDLELIHFHGRHAMERMPARTALAPGAFSVGSRRGTSSHQHNPFVILAAPGADEDAGDCLGAAFVYSGGFLAETEVDQNGLTRLVMGIQPEGFCWKLGPGETFQAPEAVLAYSDKGLTALSHRFHKAFRQHLVRGKWKEGPRPVLINNWEATYFDFTTDKLVDIAKAAAPLGVDLLVMDDGWFRNRNDDMGGLGDWEVNEEKLPGGLKALAERINAQGMQLGIWFEPEMVSERSALFASHPDWVLQIPGRAPTRSRYQLVLDLSQPAVCDYLYERIARVLRDAPIPYVKWDMNRSLSDVWSAALPADRQGETPHRYVLGLYGLLERLTRDFPDVLFEGCSGGGGRFDAGMLYYTPQIWCSDNTDAIDRLTIQYGTSFGYPISAVGAHVSAVPNHQTGRITPLTTRGIVAMCGSFGYELDLSRATAEEREHMARQIQNYKTLQPLIYEGAYYRLTDPTSDPVAACAFVGTRRECCLIMAVYTKTFANGAIPHIRLKGLDSDKTYRVRLLAEAATEWGREWRGLAEAGGDLLMSAGLSLPRPRGDYGSLCLLLEEQD